jgi:hypothetical protein
MAGRARVAIEPLWKHVGQDSYRETAMPAEIVRDEDVPQLAAQIDSAAMLRVLRLLQQTGFIQNGQEVDQETLAILQRLASLGLADPGYAESPAANGPFIWVRNSNGERVLKYLEGTLGPRLRVSRLAHTVLASLSEKERQSVLAAVEWLLTRPPASWPRELLVRLDPDKPAYLMRVTPELRAFITVLDSGGIELTDIVREDTLRLFLERYRAGDRVG